MADEIIDRAAVEIVPNFDKFASQLTRKLAPAFDPVLKKVSSVQSGLGLADRQLEKMAKTSARINLSAAESGSKRVSASVGRASDEATRLLQVTERVTWDSALSGATKMSGAVDDVAKSVTITQGVADKLDFAGSIAGAEKLVAGMDDVATAAASVSGKLDLASPLADVTRLAAEMDEAAAAASRVGPRVDLSGPLADSAKLVRNFDDATAAAARVGAGGAGGGGGSPGGTSETQGGAAGTAAAFLGGYGVFSKGDEAAKTGAASMTKYKLATLAAATALGGLAGEGLQNAASLEQLTVSLTTLLGSEDEALSQIRDLQKFAAETPFEFQGLAQSFNQFLAIGYKADEILEKTQDGFKGIVPTIGDVASVLGQGSDSIDRVQRQIAQMVSLGKVTRGDLQAIGFALPGFNATKAVADKLGVSVDDITKSNIDAKEGVDALLESMREFPGAAGAMAAQAETLNGMFSTFKDTVKLTLTNAFQPLVPVVKKTLGPLTSVVEVALKGVATPLAKFAGSISGPILDVMAKLAPAIEPVMTSIFRTLEPLVIFGTQVAGALGPPLIEIFNKLVSAAEPFLGLLTTLGSGLVDSIAPIFDKLSPSLDTIATAFSNVAEAIAPAVDAMLINAQPAIADLADSLPELATAVADLIVSLTPLAAAIADAFGQDLVDVVIPAVTTIVDLLADFVGALATLSGPLQDSEGHLNGWGKALAAVGAALLVIKTVGLGGIVANIAKFAGSIILFADWGAILGGIGSALSAVGTAIAGVLSGPVLLIAAAIAAIAAVFVVLYLKVEPVRKVMDAIGRAFRDFFVTLVQDPGKWLDTMGAGFERIGKAIGGAFMTAVRAVGGFLTSIPGWIESANDWISSLPGKLLRWIGRGFADAFNTAKRAGADFLSWLASLPGKALDRATDMAIAVRDGIISGIEAIPDLLDSVGDWFSELPNRIINAVGNLGMFLWNRVFVPAGEFLTQTLPQWGMAALEWFKELPGNIVEAIGDLGAAIWNEAIEPAADFVTNEIPRAFHSVLDWFEELPGRIADAVTGLGHTLFEAGKDLLSGLWDGIKDAASGTLDLGKKIVNAVIGFINDHVIDNINRFLEFEIAGISINPPDIRPIPKFAYGDVVNRPTLGVFGEDGPEMIVPLSKPKRAMELIEKAGLRGFADGAIVGDITPEITRQMADEPRSIDFQALDGMFGKWVEVRTGQILGYSMAEDSLIFKTEKAARAHGYEAIDDVYGTDGGSRGPGSGSGGGSYELKPETIEAIAKGVALGFGGIKDIGAWKPPTDKANKSSGSKKSSSSSKGESEDSSTGLDSSSPKKGSDNAWTDGFVEMLTIVQRKANVKTDAVKGLVLDTANDTFIRAFDSSTKTIADRLVGAVKDLGGDIGKSYGVPSFADKDNGYLFTWPAAPLDRSKPKNADRDGLGYLTGKVLDSVWVPSKRTAKLGKDGKTQVDPDVDPTDWFGRVGAGGRAFAQGDIVDHPTLGVFGEAGPEVVIPLSKPKRAMELLRKVGIPHFADGAVIGKFFADKKDRQTLSHWLDEANIKGTAAQRAEVRGVSTGDALRARTQIGEQALWRTLNALGDIKINTKTGAGTAEVPKVGKLKVDEPIFKVANTVWDKAGNFWDARLYSIDKNGKATKNRYAGPVTPQSPLPGNTQPKTIAEANSRAAATGLAGPDLAAQAAFGAGLRGDALVLATAIAGPESGYDPNQLFDNPKTGDLSYGLWQINMINSLGPARRRQFGIANNEALFAPPVNAKAMNTVSGGGKNFAPWSTFKKGKHLAYMDKALAAARKISGSGVSAGTSADVLKAGSGGGNADAAVKGQLGGSESGSGSSSGGSGGSGGSGELKAPGTIGSEFVMALGHELDRFNGDPQKLVGPFNPLVAWSGGDAMSHQAMLRAFADLQFDVNLTDKDGSGYVRSDRYQVAIAPQGGAPRTWESDGWITGLEAYMNAIEEARAAREAAAAEAESASSSEDGSSSSSDSSSSGSGGGTAGKGKNWFTRMAEQGMKNAKDPKMVAMRTRDSLLPALHKELDRYKLNGTNIKPGPKLPADKVFGIHGDSMVAHRALLHAFKNAKWDSKVGDAGWGYGKVYLNDKTFARIQIGVPENTPSWVRWDKDATGKTYDMRPTTKGSPNNPTSWGGGEGRNDQDEPTGYRKPGSGGVFLGDGGVIQPRQGGVPATIAERGAPEAVLPLPPGVLEGLKAIGIAATNGGLGATEAKPPVEFTLEQHNHFDERVNPDSVAADTVRGMKAGAFLLDLGS